ncbi:hypothetical protein [Pseudarthrobacter oxydans]|uniref:hypothetical protein n=1 Tax=Pseudarthrobacter oxydans TaxID=1671 RepID=UPI00344DD1B6
MTIFAETDPEEVQFSQRIMQLFDRAEKLSTALEPLIVVAEGSRLSTDDARTPHYAVSDYAFGQLGAAGGCVAALKQMIVRESDETISMVTGPYGSYALIRNAMDAAATALWLLEPGGTMRIKRRLLLALDEVEKANAFRRAMDWATVAPQRRARLKEVAGLAGLGDWKPRKEDVPSMTGILGQLERYHRNAVFPWLAAWQLASGHAHGKQWAYLASHELKAIESTRTETGSQFQVTIRYGMLAGVLLEAVQLFEVAADRYRQLATA